ncbi:MAG: phosphate signaling complex protein PhoU [Firmicutes bacterium]|nr:phosphate signaling complex protein PhoU [Bacillota bacterium]
MRERYNEQLNNLHEKLIEMGNLCQEAIGAAASSLMVRQDEERRKAFAADEKIDALEREIEDLCMRLLLQQQPVARDLRSISSALKMISDMERIGDQAADIAELAQYLAENKLKEKELLLDMAKAAVEMVDESVAAFVEGDLRRAHQVIAQDDEVDGLFNKIRQELLKGEVEMRVGLDLLMAGKYLERIGDHAVNIAEWVEYSITGEHKSHEHQLWEQ